MIAVLRLISKKHSASIIVPILHVEATTIDQCCTEVGAVPSVQVLIMRCHNLPRSSCRIYPSRLSSVSGLWTTISHRSVTDGLPARLRVIRQCFNSCLLQCAHVITNSRNLKEKNKLPTGIHIRTLLQSGDIVPHGQGVKCQKADACAKWIKLGYM